MKHFLILGGLIAAFSCACLAQTYRAAFYHPYEGTMLMATLADDTGPRALAVQNLDQNFYSLKTYLGANAVVIRLVDESDYVGEGGGGAPYNPSAANDNKPQFAVAQEIILDIAQKYGLAVFFTIEPSLYHKWAQASDPGGAPGSWDFIHALMAPQLYYGNPCTTQLYLVGLSNTCVRSYFDDPRVAGWIFGGEWNVTNNSSEISYLANYWNFFYSIVHWGGSQTGKAMVYAVPGPEGGASTAYQSIKNLKQVFTQYGLSTPDMLGLEWYGDAPYNLANIGADVTTLIGAAENVDPNYPGDFALPASKVFMSEGGSRQSLTQANGALNQFYSQAIYTGRTAGLGAVSVWASDTYIESFTNTYPVVQAPPSNTLTPAGPTAFLSSESMFALFNVSYSTYPTGYTRSYSAPPSGYWLHDGTGTCSPSMLPDYFCPSGYNNDNPSPNKNKPYYTTFPVASGALRYLDMTSAGHAVAEAFGLYPGNTYMYANPGPIRDDGTGLGQTTLHFSTTAASSVYVRVNSPTGPITCALGSTGACATGKWVTNGMVFYLTNASTGNVLFTTYVQVIPY